MKNVIRILALFVLASSPLIVRAENIAIVGDTIYTMNGNPIKNGVVLVSDGKISAIGPADSVKIPADCRVLKAAVVTPGLIDAHATVGLSGLLNQPQDQDMWEKSAPMQPELRAIDAYNAKDTLVSWVRSFGVTTVNTGHAPTALISGQTMIAKTLGRTADEDVINPAAMTSVTLGRNGLTFAEGPPGSGGGSAAKPPGTRAKAVAMLRAEIIRAQEYAHKREGKDESKRPGRDLRLEAILRAIDGSQPFLVTVNRQQDILSALRLAKEFNLKIILDGCADAPLVLDEIKASGFPVIVHPTMQRTYEDMENLSVETAGKLHAAGIPIAMQSSYEGYVPKTRIVLFEAAVAAANGLGFDAALASITIDAAKLLGIADRTGSLQPGKDADLALYDGDPFEYTSHCVGTLINGQVFADGPH
ncbi:MAG: amidohydrolase [Verrucomicrobia bacterium]|nr:amidohydrolase [Verrucomicrobiota bacterium]